MVMIRRNLPVTSTSPLCLDRSQ